MEAIIIEIGNGFPNPRNYVPGFDGNLYLFLRFVGPIHTGSPGSSNYSYAEVELADWDDLDDDEKLFPCECIIEEKQ